MKRECRHVKGAGTKIRQRKQTNVLLSSVGRRSYLVHYFREALAGRGLVIATNSLTFSPGMAAADVGCVIPAASDDCFLEELIGLCVKYRVKMLFSLHDWEAPFIAANLEKFIAVGTVPVVSTPSVIGICLDKLKTQEFARRNEIAHPFTVSNPKDAGSALLAGRLKAPVVVKPRFGQARSNCKRSGMKPILNLCISC